MTLEKYETAEMEVIEFEAEDVIACSGNNLPLVPSSPEDNNDDMF